MNESGAARISTRRVLVTEFPNHFLPSGRARRAQDLVNYLQPSAVVSVGDKPGPPLSRMLRLCVFWHRASAYPATTLILAALSSPHLLLLPLLTPRSLGTWAVDLCDSLADSEEDTWFTRIRNLISRVLINQLHRRSRLRCVYYISPIDCQLDRAWLPKGLEIHVVEPTLAQELINLEIENRALTRVILPFDLRQESNRVMLHFLIEKFQGESVSFDLYGPVPPENKLETNFRFRGYAGTLTEIYGGGGIVAAFDDRARGIQNKVLEACLAGLPVVCSRESALRFKPLPTIHVVENLQGLESTIRALIGTLGPILDVRLRAAPLLENQI